MFSLLENKVNCSISNFFYSHTFVLDPTLILPWGSELSEALLPSWKLGTCRLVWNLEADEWARGLLSDFSENGNCPWTWFLEGCGSKRAPGEVKIMKEGVGELSAVALSARSTTISADIDRQKCGLKKSLMLNNFLKNTVINCLSSQVRLLHKWHSYKMLCFCIQKMDFIVYYF